MIIINVYNMHDAAGEYPHAAHDSKLGRSQPQ